MKNNEHNVVDLYAGESENRGGALNPLNEYKAVTERIPYNLNNIPQLTFPQSLYVLDSSLEGHQHLYSHVGPYDINRNMIGFTPDGRNKNWFNENYGINYPSRPIRRLEKSR